MSFHTVCDLDYRGGGVGGCGLCGVGWVGRRHHLVALAAVRMKTHDAEEHTMCRTAEDEEDNRRAMNTW